MTAEQEEDRSALEADRSLSVWVAGTLKRCVQGAMSSDAGKFEVSRFCGRKMIVLMRIVSNNESAFLTLSYVCPHCGLLPIEDRAPNQKEEAV